MSDAAAETLTPDTDTRTETHGFQAEVGRLLDIVAKSLYSQKEVFLRELISNASDACDKLRYEAISKPDLIAGDSDFEVHLATDQEAGVLVVSDNGIGMDRQDLIDNLGTIARSGTLAFTTKLAEQAAGGAEKADAAKSLIGQFGVGFYAAFMVADKVAVTSRKAGTDEAWAWESDGRTGFTIRPATAEEAPARGTRIAIHLAKDEREYLEDHRLRHIVKTYSDHIPIPIVLDKPAVEVVAPSEEGGEPAASDDAGIADTGIEDTGPERLNRASALWTRSKSEISEDEYTEFYHHVGHAFDQPWETIHYRAEGMLEYTALLYVPTMAPFDLYQPERKHGVKLYVRRVFVADQAEGLLPPYLRFLRGVVDSEDLPLNVSRELLQNNPMVAKIKKGLAKRVLSEIAKRAKRDAEPAEEGEDKVEEPGYTAFWEAFGPVIKEGLHEDFENRETLIDLARFKSTEAEGWVSLDEYVGRMKDGQDAIFYITGEDIEQIARSPQLEGFKAKGIEVLYFTDPVDEFWPGALGGRVKDKELKSITRGAPDLSGIKGKEDTEEKKDEPRAEGLDALLASFKLSLGEEVQDVRESNRLTDSPVCLVADEAGLDLHMERLLKRHKQLDQLSKRVLEVNPGHPLVTRLAGLAAADGAGSSDVLGDMAFLLLDQARILEGEAVPDAAAFSRRMTEALARGLH